MDLSKKLFDYVMVEREGHAFPVSVQFERKPQYCAHCKLLGHSIQNCMKIGYTILIRRKVLRLSLRKVMLEFRKLRTKHMSEKVFDNEVVSIVDRNLMKEGVNVDETVGPVINKNMEAYPSLTLHNLFHMLDTECEL